MSALTITLENTDLKQVSTIQNTLTKQGIWNSKNVTNGNIKSITVRDNSSERLYKIQDWIHSLTSKDSN